MLKYSHKTVSTLLFQALTIQYHFESEDDYRSLVVQMSVTVTNNSLTFRTTLTRRITLDKLVIYYSSVA